MLFQRVLDLIIKNKGVVYTSITGDYDDLLTPLHINENWDYICFTDKDIKSDFWQIKQIGNSNLDPVRKAKKYKILPHRYLSAYDYSLYIDANFIIIGDIDKFVNKYSKVNPMLCLVHPD